jgi:hypothetical protein
MISILDPSFAQSCFNSSRLQRITRLLLAFCAALFFIRGPALSRSAEAAEATCEEILVPLADGTRLHGWARHGSNAGAKRPIV